MIPVFVPATPLRPDYRPILQDRLGGPDLVTFMVDSDMRGAWWNLRRCLEFAVIQGIDTFATVHEDVYPVDDFQRHLTNAVAAQSGRFFSGFVQHSSYKQVQVQPTAYRYGYSWVYYYRVTSQCFVWPAAFVLPFLAWVDEQEQRKDLWREAITTMRREDMDDFRIVHYHREQQGLPFSQARKVKILATCPSLVEHLGKESSCPNPATGGFQTWQFHAQTYNTVLERDAWGTSIYEDPGLYGSGQ